ncbi:hypothetical protein [Moraxella sp. Pampa]|uniref:hypothetical protein n=1 Tax=Moraxella sp. Pampa TaxID=3111978 RepID=UPI002B406773|nr:hypothetical protein [Moraxella sp. Pampa]
MTKSAQVRANIAYQNRALLRTSLVISEHEQAVFDALQAIKAHYEGNQAYAIKQAILAHARAIKGE